MWKDKIIAAVVTFQRNKILPLSIMNCCAVFWHLTWLPGSYFIFHRYLNQRSPLLQLYTVYLVLISLRSFFNFFISMKPQCWEENNNNWSWCHDRRSVVFFYQLFPLERFQCQRFVQTVWVVFEEPVQQLQTGKQNMMLFLLKKKLSVSNLCFAVYVRALAVLYLGTKTRIKAITET